VVVLVSLALLVPWERPVIKRFKFSLWVQGPLVAVVVGIVLNAILQRVAPGWAIGASHLVQIPTLEGLGEALAVLTFPDFGQLANPAVYTTALTLAVVASLETLLCVEATDKLDPQKRVPPTDRELKAQGLGNLISGLLGGLPVTQVIVKSSANIQSGARSKLSAILHGVLLLGAVLTMPALLNRIPLAVLAAIGLSSWSRSPGGMRRPPEVFAQQRAPDPAPAPQVSA
jgi:carbonic anhydrase